MAQALGRWPLAAEAWAQSYVSHVGFVADQVSRRQRFSSVLQFSLVSTIPLQSCILIHLSPTRRNLSI